MLKRILYCSAAQQRQPVAYLPTDISTIIIERRHYNATHDVTGFLCFKSGYYLEAIEGPETTITALYQGIRHDNRHKDVITLLEEDDLTSRYFQSWSLKLSSASSDNNHIALFLEQKWPLLKNNDESKLKGFHHFYNSNIQEPDVSFPRLKSLYHFELKMLSLPYTNSDLPGAHDLLDIYAHLLMRWATFAELQNIFALSIDDLYQLLNKLYSDNLLSIRETEHYASIKKKQQVTNSTPSGFYQQLRSFFLKYT